MAKFYIFRHGETFATKASKGYGWRMFSASILNEGIPAIEKMGIYLKSVPSDFNASSHYRRCRQTVGIVSSVCGKGFVFDRRLNEYFLETFNNFHNRLKSFLDFVQKNEYGSVLICTHGACIAVLLKILRGQTPSKQDLFYYPRPGVLTIVEGKKIEEVDFN